MNIAFPKPSQVRKPQEAVKVFRDGREVCRMMTKIGRDEYSNRVRRMWERQGRKCGLIISPQCQARNGRLLIDEAQFDHETPRRMGSGSRDDRIEIDGKPVSRAVCCWCNCLRGSRPLSDFEELIP